MLRSLKASNSASQREAVSETSTSVATSSTSTDLSYDKSSLAELPRSYSEFDLSSVPSFHNREAEYFSRRFKAPEQKCILASTGEWRSYAGSNGRCRPSNVAPSDFINIGMLGRGDVGHVYLVRKHGTSNLMAMKVLSKKDMIQRKKVDRALMEQKILMRLNHPFLVTLHETFQTDTHLYFCMDYCSGGEFFKALQSLPGKRLCEADALFYTAEVVLALEYLHLMGFIYRDLKPENVLLRDSGHIVLSDFDLAKHDAFGQPTLQKSDTTIPLAQAPRLNTRSCVQTVRTNSFVGTEEYIAPEIVLGQHHGSEVDWWTLGIFVYEMLYATTPFKGTSRNKTFQNILTGSVWFPEAIILPSSPKAQSMPPKLSSSCKSFIKSLLNKDPRGRLGYQAGAGDVRAHKWFRDINFALVRNTKPPLQPECCEIFDGSPGRSLEWCKETTRKQSNPSVDSTDPFDQFCSVSLEWN